MKRGGPLRRSQLKASKGLRRGRGLKRAWFSAKGRGKGLSRKGSRNAHKPRKGWEVSRAACLERDRYTCRRAACGWRARTVRERRFLHAHHLLSRARGGTDELPNLATLCWKCHGGVHDHSLSDWRRWILRKEVQIEGGLAVK